MASKFMLCSFKTCPWVQRAAIVLRAKQVPYDITYIDRDNEAAPFGSDCTRAQSCMDRLRADLRKRYIDHCVFGFRGRIYLARSEDRRAVREARGGTGQARQC